MQLFADEEPKAVLDMMNNYVVSVLGYDLNELEFQPAVDARIDIFHALFHKGEDDLYIRFGKYCEYSGKVIVVARICFEKQKRGYGTALISRLIRIAEKYNYEKIIFEAANSKCKAFAKKIGFANEMNQSIELIKQAIQLKS